jgi:hypothetical protein
VKVKLCLVGYVMVIRTGSVVHLDFYSEGTAGSVVAGDGWPWEGEVRVLRPRSDVDQLLVRG